MIVVVILMLVIEIVPSFLFILCLLLADSYSAWVTGKWRHHKSQHYCFIKKEESKKNVISIKFNLNRFNGQDTTSYNYKTWLDRRFSMPGGVYYTKTGWKRCDHSHAYHYSWYRSFFPCRTCMSRISDSTEMRIADHTFISTHRLRFGRCVRPKGCYKNRHSRE